MISCFSIFKRRSKRADQFASHDFTQFANHKSINHLACCSFEPLSLDEKEGPPSYPTSPSALCLSDRLMAEIAKTIERKAKQLDSELRTVSLDIWNLKELKWQEFKTHNLLVDYLKQKAGWKVTPQAYGLATAFVAEFVHQSSDEEKMVKGGEIPTIGFCSELDALPGIGHACGHNLIAIAGILAALTVADALEKHDIAGKVILVGTPAEEGGGGKINLLESGVFDKMDACLMTHPTFSDSVGAMLAVVPLYAEFKGKTAHAGAAPWEGRNALDAGVLSYLNISALRQQIKPTCRVHGILSGQDWAANVIPDNCHLEYNIRAPSVAELKVLVKRVEDCFKAASMATGCEVSLRRGPTYKDVVNNTSLQSAYRGYMEPKFHKKISNILFEASTDFGNITYALPSLHSLYKIPLQNPETDKNHTVGFAAAAKTPEAHAETIKSATGLAVTGARIIADEGFRDESWKAWKEWHGKAQG